MWARRRPHGGKSDRNCSEAFLRGEWSFKWRYDRRESREINGRGLPRPKLWLGQISLDSEDQLQGSFSHSHTHIFHTQTYATKLLRATAAEKASGAGSWSMRREILAEIVYYSGFDCDICGNGDLIFAALRFKIAGCSTPFQSCVRSHLKRKMWQLLTPPSFPMVSLLHDGMKKR